MTDTVAHRHEWTLNDVCKVCGITRLAAFLLAEANRPANPFCRELETCSGSCQREIACNE